MDLVRFTARSENRIEVLSTLAGAPWTRPELQEETGIPRATVSRILADFRDRDLVVREGHRYRTTPLGDVLAAGYASLVASVESARPLQTLSAWLPLDELGVEFDALADAEVTLPTPTDPTAPVRRVAAVTGAAEHVRTACYSVVHPPILASLRGIDERGQRLEGVVDAGVLDVFAADPDLAELARGLFESDGAELYLAAAEIDPQLIVADRVTMFLVTDEEGLIQGLVETGEESIRRWAEARFESAKEDAEPLDPEAAIDRLTG